MKPDAPLTMPRLLPTGPGMSGSAARSSPTAIVTVAWQQVSVGKHRAGRVVDIHLDGPTMQIWDGPELLKTVLRDNAKEVRKKRAARKAG